MKVNKEQRSVKIISEIHPQNMGSILEAERMILQSKLNGADYVKVQLYSSQKLFGNNDREFIEITRKEFKHLVNYSKDLGIEMFASVFDEERLDWCEEEDIQIHKIASRTVEDTKLCEKIISTGKKIIFSLGMHDYKKLGIPFKDKNIQYLYCVSKYPTNLEDIDMPDFNDSIFTGFSDHTIGTSACLFAVSKGAKIIEKHFSFNKSQNVTTQMAHVCSMDEEDLKEIRFHADNFTLLNKLK
jgi:sialic acid synthase SpsE